MRLQPENQSMEPIYAERPDPGQGHGGVPHAVSVEPLDRTLEQELNALLRGVNLECLVCGECVLHRVDGIACPECGAEYGKRPAAVQLTSQAG